MNQVEPESADPICNANDTQREAESSLRNTTYWVEYENTLLISAYPVLLLKGVDNVDLEYGTCKIQATFVLNIMTEGLQKEYPFIVESLKEGMNFRMNEKPYTLRKEEPDVEIKTIEKPCRNLVFTYRFETKVSFLPDLRSSPFDKLFIPIRFELTSRDFTPPKAEGKRIHVRFNFHKNISQTLKFKDSLIENLIEFNLSYPDMNVAIKKEEKKKNSESPPDIMYAPVMVFTLCLYRLPHSVLINSMGPLLFMMVIPLAIYFQPDDLANKLSSLITLLLAIIAYLPVLRSKLPSMPYFTITDLVAYACIIQVFIGVLEALCLNKLDAVIFSWICLGFLLSLPVLVFVFLLLKLTIYRFRKFRYDKRPLRVNVTSSRFDPNEWETLAGLKAIGSSKEIYRYVGK